MIPVHLNDSSSLTVALRVIFTTLRCLCKWYQVMYSVCEGRKVSTGSDFAIPLPYIKYICLAINGQDCRVHIIYIRECEEMSSNVKIQCLLVYSLYIVYMLYIVYNSTAIVD